jgi:hypothetical protein
MTKAVKNLYLIDIDNAGQKTKKKKKKKNGVDMRQKHKIRQIGLVYS